MTPEQQTVALSIAREVRSGKLTWAEGARQLYDRANVNIRSSRIIIGVFLRMMEGRKFTFRPSETDLRFLMLSFEEDSLPSLAAAIQALEGHIAHRERQGHSQPTNKEILAQYTQRYLELARSKSEVQRRDVPLLRQIVDELNVQARHFNIGELQALRKRIKGKKRLALSGGALFHDDSVDPKGDWAFHYGGRTELQFNIGLEKIDGEDCLRFGVAFSLEASQTLPDITQLYPNISRFNEYIELYPEQFRGYLLWYWDDSKRSTLYTAPSIRPEFVKKNRFIFFGKYVRLNEYSSDLVLRTFDELLPLYMFVEGQTGTYPLQIPEAQPFTFQANDFDGVDTTQYSKAERLIDVNLRHVRIQRGLFKRLREQFGVENVCCETSSGVGVRVDVMVRSGGEYWFYEVKTGGTARSCIREALGQLLEYAYWPGAQIASRLIVVGEPAADEEARMYLNSLRQRFRLPLEYEQQLGD